MLGSKLYTTDEKVRWFESEEDVNSKLISIIGIKFEDYRVDKDYQLELRSSNEISPTMILTNKDNKVKTLELISMSKDDSEKQMIWFCPGPI